MGKLEHIGSAGPTILDILGFFFGGGGDFFFFFLVGA